MCSICTLFFSLLGNKCYAAISPTASLSVSNPTLSATVAPGDTAYLSSNVTYSASDIDSYTLQVSYANGYSSLKLDGGTTTLTGANGTSGSNLANNSWGFAWTNNTTNNDTTNAGLTYYTVPTYGTNGSGLSTGRLENVTLPESANNTLDSTTKRIVFAAKFAENNNNSGHYKTGVQLSMVATPRKLIGLEKANTMQDLATHPEYCEETPYLTNQTYSDAYPLKDSRDDNVYNIRKFADGKCWMTDNLKLKLTTAGLSKDDTDLNQGLDWNQSSPSTVVKPTNTFTSVSSGDGTFNGIPYKVESYIVSSSSAGETGYYSWNAATAGTGGTSHSDVIATNSQAPSSICPKGWKLPSGSSSGEYEAFATTASITSDTAGSTKIQATPYNFKYTGHVYDGSLDGTSSGYWWSSTANDASYAYNLRVISSYVDPGTVSGARYVGYAVRCVMRDPDLSEITTMQEMTPRVCEKTPFISGQKYSAEYTLQDTRDGKSYTVRKLGDGRCWMTSNLKLKLTTAGLSKDDTDLNQGADWNQSSLSTVVKPTNTLTSLNTSSGNRDFSADKGYYAVQSYIASSSNAGETGYYSWNAATAGTGGTDSSNAIAANSQAPSSICPKGWKLPTGGRQSNVNTENTWSDYYKLFRNMGLTISNTSLKPGLNEYTNWGSGDLNIVQNATDSNSKVIYNFKYTGYVLDGSLGYGTSDGYWWSSTAYNADYAYHLYILSGGVGPGTVGSSRYRGYAVRCIARDS